MFCHLNNILQHVFFKNMGRLSQVSLQHKHNFKTHLTKLSYAHIYNWCRCLGLCTDFTRTSTMLNSGISTEIKSINGIDIGTNTRYWYCYQYIPR